MRKILVAGMLILLNWATQVRAQEVPTGVTYRTTSEESNKKAEELLRHSLSQKPVTLGLLPGKNSAQPLFLGGFLSGELIQKKLIDPARFARVDYRIPLSAEVTPVFTGVAARNGNEKIELDKALTSILAPDTAQKIRKLTPKEMALIWTFIGWDITEPVFAVENKGRTFVIDFQDDGQSILWIEDITEPCFKVAWEGGGLDDCFCTVIQMQGSKYGLGFEPKKGVSCGTAHADHAINPTSYQNPVDGKTYTAEWEKYVPQGGPVKDSGARVTLEDTRLLTGQDLIGRNISVEDLAGFIKKTQDLLVVAIASFPGEFELLIKVTISKDADPVLEMARMTDVDEATIQKISDAFNTLPNLRSKQESFAFQYHFKVKKKA